MGLWDGVIAPTEPKAPSAPSNFWGSPTTPPAAAPSTFSFNDILTPKPVVEPIPEQQGFFSRMGTAISNFFTPPTATKSPIPASLYEQAHEAASRHVMDNYIPDTSLYGTPSTPQATPTGTLDIAKGLGQGLARIPAEFAITAGQAGLSIHDMALPPQIVANAKKRGIDLSSVAQGDDLTSKTDAGVSTDGLAWLLGDQPIKGYGSQILDLSEKIQQSPFAQSLGIDKHALPLAFAGVVGGEALNFTGAGSEESAIKALAATTDVADTVKILRTIGVQEDLLMPVAQKLAPLKDAAAIKDALTMVETLQKTTALTTKIADHAAGIDNTKLSAVRDSLAKNLETATGAKRTAIQSQIDVINEKLATSGVRKSVPDAAAHYKQTIIDSANESGGLVEISGDEIKKMNGGDYAPENSRAYSVEAYKQAEHEIVNGPKKDIIMLGGGPGAGKSEMVAKALKANGFDGLLYDTTLSNYEGTKHLIDLAKKAGKNVEIHAILPDIGEARIHTIEREIQTGRPVTDEDFARGHAGFVETLSRLIENGDIAPENVHLTDARGADALKSADPLATLKEVGYTKEDIQSTYAKQNILAKNEGLLQKSRAQGSVDGVQETNGIVQNKGIKVNPVDGKKTIIDTIPLPKTVGELLSNRMSRGQFHATPIEPRETGIHVPQSREPRTSGPKSSIQSTTQKIDASIKGAGVDQRVRNAVGRSQTLGTQITNKGQEAYIAGRGLSDKDLAIIRDGYQAGRPIEEIVKKTGNPVKATAFIEKMRDYYDYELAADRAAGGDTPRVENYIPQYWDLNNPIDKTRFDDLAKQKGIKPYYGFRSSAKVFKSYAEGIAAGFQPLRQNILEDLKANYSAASTAISRQALKRGLKEAAPDMVGMSGYGMTPEGVPFVNSNIPGLEGLSYHPAIDRHLQGFQPLRSKDFIDLVKKSGADAALEHVGIMGQIDKMVAMAKSVPANAKEAGMSGVLGSIYDHVSAPMKQVLWNWSGFHSVNITLSHMGASSLHPITGAKGVLQSVGAAVSERLYNATVDSYKALMVGKDAQGAQQSVYDWAVESGALESRQLPAHGIEHFHPFAGGHRLIFDREIPVLQMNLAEQAARKGIVASSPEGMAIGREIRAITGEINAKTMNINPNTIKAGSRFFLAPGFTFSKYKTMLDAFTAWGEEHGAAGNIARTAVIGKSAIIGVAATLGTLLATGKFPNLQQLLMNFTFNPSVQTNFSDPKGRKLDITFPKTFLAEGAGAILDPIAYANARLNPLISDFIKLKTNKDYYDRPLVDPNVKTSTALQLAQNLGVGHLPIGAQSIVNTMMGKQTKLQAAIQIGGLGTHVSPNDPIMVKYAGIDHTKALISDLAPNDPDREEKMQEIFNSLPPDQRKSLAYQEMLAGVSTKGIYQSEVERQYFQVQDLLQKGDTAGAAAITKAMSKQDYQTYRSIKTRLAHVAIFKQVKDLVAKGDMKGAAALTGAMTKQEYSSYQTWKKNNP